MHVSLALWKGQIQTTFFFTLTVGSTNGVVTNSPVSCAIPNFIMEDFQEDAGFHVVMARLSSCPVDRKNMLVITTV
jgi:hypothetical protein